MLPAHIALATLQNALLARFQKFATNECNYYKRIIYFFQSDTVPLEQVTLQTVSDSSCNTTFGGVITDRMICAGDPNGVKAGCSVIGS
jgi:hypothetical protein